VGVGVGVGVVEDVGVGVTVGVGVGVEVGVGVGVGLVTGVGVGVGFETGVGVGVGFDPPFPPLGCSSFRSTVGLEEPNTQYPTSKSNFQGKRARNANWGPTVGCWIFSTHQHGFQLLEPLPNAL